MYFIAVHFEIVGYHKWPQAPQQYEYLRALHRHNFTFDVEMDENGSRFMEINDVQGSLENLVRCNHGNYNEPYDLGAKDFGAFSCEDLANEVKEICRALYPQVDLIEVFVREDGLQGGGVKWKSKYLRRTPF